jgi:hypothetical protein
MKKIGLLFCAITFATFCYAQAAKVQKSDTVFVRVTNWGTKSMNIGESVWNKANDQIVSQVGELKLRQIKSNYEWNILPGQMSIFDGKKVKSMEEYSSKMDSLQVMYRIATFNNLSGGKNWGKLAIIEVPYKGNENWDTKAKWDVVYFIVDANAVKEL